MVFGSVSLSTPFVGVFLLIVVLGWIVAAQSLGRQFNHLTKQDEKIDIEELVTVENTSTKKVSAT